jgi:hypothetical protein
LPLSLDVIWRSVFPLPKRINSTRFWARSPHNPFRIYRIETFRRPAVYLRRGPLGGWNQRKALGDPENPSASSGLVTDGGRPCCSVVCNIIRLRRVMMRSELKRCRSPQKTAGFDPFLG